MKIQIKLLGHYQRGRFSKTELILPNNYQLKHIVRQLDIPESRDRGIFINGQVAQLNHPLKNNDVVTFYPKTSATRRCAI